MRNVVRVPSDAQQPNGPPAVGSMWKGSDHQEGYNVYMVVGKEGQNVDLLSGDLHEDNFDFPGKGWVEIFDLSISRLREERDL